MSFAQFDDFLEICSECIEEEVMKKVEKVEKVEVRVDRIPEDEKWWNEALKEVEKEQEKELLHV